MVEAFSAPLLHILRGAFRYNVQILVVVGVQRLPDHQIAIAGREHRAMFVVNNIQVYEALVHTPIRSIFSIPIVTLSY